jgi:hypothetical protein
VRPVSKYLTRHDASPYGFQTNLRLIARCLLTLCFWKTENLSYIDAGTRFQAATFLVGEDFASVWYGFVKCWSRLFLGDPEKIVADQGSVFNADEFQQMCVEHGISFQSTGTESHKSHGAGERYHHPLRQVYRKLRSEYATVPIDVVIQCAVHAMNTTMGPEGLVP